MIGANKSATTFPSTKTDAKRRPSCAYGMPTTGVGAPADEEEPSREDDQHDRRRDELGVKAHPLLMQEPATVFVRSRLARGEGSRMLFGREWLSQELRALVLRGRLWWPLRRRKQRAPQHQGAD